jgi:hypothetical protein
MIVVISYDLRNPKRDYGPLFDAIKQQGRWWHYLKSTWILETRKTPQEIIDDIEPLLSESDRILAFEMAGEYYGILPDRAWRWRDKHVASEKAPS